VHIFITHRPALTLQLHKFDLFRTCRTSSLCTVAWQLARFQLTQRIARSLGDSWASCCIKRPNSFMFLWYCWEPACFCPLNYVSKIPSPLPFANRLSFHGRGGSTSDSSAAFAESVGTRQTNIAVAAESEHASCWLVSCALTGAKPIDMQVGRVRQHHVTEVLRGQGIKGKEIRRRRDGVLSSSVADFDR